MYRTKLKHIWDVKPLRKSSDNTCTHSCSTGAKRTHSQVQLCLCTIHTLWFNDILVVCRIYIYMKVNQISYRSLQFVHKNIHSTCTHWCNFIFTIHVRELSCSDTVLGPLNLGQAVKPKLKRSDKQLKSEMYLPSVQSEQSK